MRWAVVDATGRIVEHGVAPAADIFKQRKVLKPGHVFATRPEHVTCLEPWRLVGDDWIKDSETP